MLDTMSRDMPSDAPFDQHLSGGPDTFVARWIETSDGLRIRAAFWPLAGAVPARGTVLIFPGRTEYVEKYGRAARDLAARGFASLAIDWRGQGLAQRLLGDRARGHVGAFTDYQRDVAAVLAQADALNMPRPHYLIGHSMGGCIGLRSLIGGLEVNAAVFSAPMWNIQMKPLMRPIAYVLGHASAALGIGRGYAPGTSRKSYLARAEFRDNTLTTDREMWDYMQRQTHAHPQMDLGGPSTHWVHQALSECRALARLPAPDIPALCFLGTGERIVDPRPIKRRMAAWPRGRLILLDGAEHEIMMELPATRARFFDETAALFSAAP